MTTADLLSLIAEELHFEVEAAQFSGGGYIIRRISKHPSYRTEYATMRLHGDDVELVGIDKSERFSLCDPKVFEQLSVTLNSYGFLCGSLATMEVPVANKVFTSEVLEE